MVNAVWWRHQIAQRDQAGRENERLGWQLYLLEVGFWTSVSTTPAPVQCYGLDPDLWNWNAAWLEPGLGLLSWLRLWAVAIVGWCENCPEFSFCFVLKGWSGDVLHILTTVGNYHREVVKVFSFEIRKIEEVYLINTIESVRKYSWINCCGHLLEQFWKGPT